MPRLTAQAPRRCAVLRLRAPARFRSKNDAESRPAGRELTEGRPPAPHLSPRAAASAVPAERDGWFSIDRVMSLKFQGGDAEPKAPAWPSVASTATYRRPASKAGQEQCRGTASVGVSGPGRGHRGAFSSSGTRQNPPPLRPGTSTRVESAVTWDVDGALHFGDFRPEITSRPLNEHWDFGPDRQVIGEAGGNIDNVRMVRRASDFTEMRIEVEGSSTWCI